MFSQTARGITANVVILEEMAYIPQEFFNKVVTALLTVRNTCLIGISTSAGISNYMERLRALRMDNGERIFKNITVTRVCDSCLETDHPEECTHMLHMMPSWKSSETHAMCQKILEASSNTFALEMANVVGMTEGGAFSKRSLSILRDAWPTKCRLPQLVFIGLDPSPGKSDIAVCFMFYDTIQRHVVVRSCVSVVLYCIALHHIALHLKIGHDSDSVCKAA